MLQPRKNNINKTEKRRPFGDVTSSKSQRPCRSNKKQQLPRYSLKELEGEDLQIQDRKTGTVHPVIVDPHHGTLLLSDKTRFDRNRHALLRNDREVEFDTVHDKENRRPTRSKKAVSSQNVAQDEWTTNKRAQPIKKRRVSTIETLSDGEESCVPPHETLASPLTKTDWDTQPDWRCMGAIDY